MNGEEESGEQIHFNRLCSQWGPPEAHMRMAEIRNKTPEDLESWVTNCRQRATYALGRASGDGWWEAKSRWYGERANWLKAMMQPSSPMRTSQALMKRPVAMIRPMNPAPKRRQVDWSDLPLTAGGWPSGVDQPRHGQTPSGSPTGEAKDISSTPEPPSPCPSSDDTPSLDLIKEYV